jgi:hypothetical protein
LSVFTKRDIRATSRHGLEEQLEEAVRQLQQLARRTKKHGILITRHRHDYYTVALSETVPFGITRELDQWLGSPESG